jgi:hypothetical protein
LKKSKIFSKNSVAPIDFLKGRLLSEAKNSPLWIVQVLYRVSKMLLQLRRKDSKNSPKKRVKILIFEKSPQMPTFTR